MNNNYLIWNFLSQSLQPMCKILELYYVNSDIIAWFLLVIVSLLQHHMYTSIRFLFVNRLQLFPYILNSFSVDNMLKWFFIHWCSDYALSCTVEFYSAHVRFVALFPGIGRTDSSVTISYAPQDFKVMRTWNFHEAQFYNPFSLLIRTVSYSFFFFDLTVLYLIIYCFFRNLDP